MEDLGPAGTMLNVDHNCNKPFTKFVFLQRSVCEVAVRVVGPTSICNEAFTKLRRNLES